MLNSTAPLSQAVADLGLGDMLTDQLAEEQAKRKKLAESQQEQTAAYGPSILSPAAQMLLGQQKGVSN